VILPPKWSFPQSSSRLLYDIPSLPALLAYRASLDNEPGKAWVPQWARDAADQAIDDARWRLACASYQWIRGLEMLMGARDDAYRWMVVTGVARLRWIRRSSELMDYLPPSKELAVRRDG
jgi:hypothetical protein